MKSKPHHFCSYIVNNTIFMFAETVVICIYSCNNIVCVLLSNIKYSMTHISTNLNESTSSSRVCIILPMTEHDVIEYLINGLFNNSLKFYVLVWHSYPTTTSFISTFWYTTFSETMQWLTFWVTL